MRESVLIKCFLSILTLFYCSNLWGAGRSNWGTLYSVDVARHKVVDSSQVDLGDRPSVVRHSSDSSEIMIYRHRDSLTTAMAIPFGGYGGESSDLDQSLCEMDVFRSRYSFVAFGRSCDRGCLVSPNGVDSWVSLGRMEMDSTVVDMLINQGRSRWEIYYHHTSNSPQSSAIIRAELDRTANNMLCRDVEIKHNKLCFSNLRVLRLVHKRDYLYLCFMESEHDIYYCFDLGSGWSYPCSLGLGSGVTLIDAARRRNGFDLLVMRGGVVESVRVKSRCRDSYIATRIEPLLDLEEAQNIDVKGCYVGSKRAMIVVW